MPGTEKLARKRLYLIDGYSNIFRAFYAIRSGLSTSSGMPTNAVYGFINMLRKLLRDEEPELIGIAFDVSGATIRKEQYEDYKANRRPMPDDLKIQIPFVRRAIEAHKIPILELERYEADDVLGTLSKKAAAAGYDVVIVSADKDLMQLITENVTMMHTSRDKMYDPALVTEDFGVPPEQVIDVLALMGDASDNVPGVKGIGKVGAKKLIQKFGSVEGLLDGVEELKGAQKKKIEEGREDAILSKELVTIHTDLDIDFDPESLVLEDPDPEQLRDLFLELEFHSLADELDAGANAFEVEPAVEVTEAAVWQKLQKQWVEEPVIAAIGSDPVIGLAVETTEGAIFADLRGDEKLRSAVLESVAERFRAEGQVLGHDLKEVLRAVGFADGGREVAPLLDLHVASFIAQPDLRHHGLADLAMRHLHYKSTTEKEAGWEKKSDPMAGSVALLQYAGERIALARGVLEPIERELGEGTLETIYRELEEPLIPLLLRMEERGIELNGSFLEAMSTEMTADLEGVEKSIYEIAGDSFNINSPAQLGEVLFERLGYPSVKKTRKTKSYSTDSETLEKLASQGYEIADHILSYRELSKLQSTYVDALPQLVADDGRVHTRYNQVGAATGRLSSAHPNLQNIPIRTERGQQIRKAFVAPKGRSLVVADYSQVELRILAHIADEDAMISAFNSGADIHRSTAAAVLGVAEELVTEEQRRAAKAINFGIIYGISGFGLGRNLGIPKSEADRFIKDYLERYPGVEEYMTETLLGVEKTGRVETMYGRIRRLPDIHAKNRNLRENAKRMAINARIQGTAADFLKKAMIAVDAKLAADFPSASLLLTVHDELVLEVDAGTEEAIAELLRSEMSGVEQLSVPLVVDVGWGQTWYDAKD